MFSLYLFILLNGCVYDDTKQDNHEHIYYKQPKKHDSNTQSNTCPFTNNKNSCGASTSPPPPIIKTPPSKNQHLIDNTTFSDMEFCRRCATKKCAFIHEKKGNCFDTDNATSKLLP